MEDMAKFIYDKIISERKKSIAKAQSKYNEYFVFKKSWLRYKSIVTEELIKNNYKDCIPK